jgi:hypothetical protein
MRVQEISYSSPAGIPPTCFVQPILRLLGKPCGSITASVWHHAHFEEISATATSLACDLVSVVAPVWLRHLEIELGQVRFTFIHPESGHRVYENDSENKKKLLATFTFTVSVLVSVSEQRSAASASASVSVSSPLLLQCLQAITLLLRSSPPSM